MYQMHEISIYPAPTGDAHPCWVISVITRSHYSSVVGACECAWLARARATVVGDAAGWLAKLYVNIRHIPRRFHFDTRATPLDLSYEQLSVRVAKYLVGYSRGYNLPYPEHREDRCATRQ